MRFVQAFAFSMAAAVVPIWTVKALSFRGRVRWRDWCGRKLMQVGNWLYKRGVALIPSWRERADSGMEDE